MSSRRKTVVPGMTVRLAPREHASWLHRIYADKGVAGAVLGPGVGDHCWRVAFPPPIERGAPRILAVNDDEVLRLAPRKPAQSKPIARPQPLAAPPGIFVSLQV